VGKKKRDLMAQMKDKFLAGMKESDTDRGVAQDLWSLMTAAADYSFNRSHAACYALIAYRTAYLKANYPAEYMAAVISSVMSTKDKVPFFVNRCEEMDIEVLPPDVNSSEHGFVVSGKSIRFGLDAVKNVGHAAVQAILSAREAGGPYDSVWDFCERVDARAVNKRAVECLIKCGALDSTGDTRRGMLEVLAPALASASKSQEDALREKVDCSLTDVGNKEDGAWVTVGGIVSEAKKVRTRSGAYVMFATLDDLEGRVELFVRDAASESAEQIELDRVILVRGRVDHKGRGDMSLVVSEAEPFEPGEDELAAARAKAQARDPDRIVLRVNAAEFGPQLLEDLKSLFQSFPGRSEVLLEMSTREGTRRLRFGSDYSVAPSPALRAELDQLLGPRALAA
jgi:DNA polymerase III alpha subunit